VYYNIHDMKNSAARDEEFCCILGGGDTLQILKIWHI